MPGIIQQQQMPDDQQAPPSDDAAPQNAAPMQQADPSQRPGGAPDQFTPQSVRAGMTLPPALHDAYVRVVTAGMKVMFDPQTHGQMQQLLQQPGPIEQKLGTGVAGLMLLLYQQSNKTMPPKVIIPAGVELLAHAVDFLKQSGQDVPPQAVAEGTSILITTLLKKFGIDPDKLQAFAANGGAKQPPQPDEPETPDEDAQEAPADEQAEEEPPQQQPQGA